MDGVKDTFRTWYEWFRDMPQPKKIKLFKAAAFVCFSFFLLFVVIYGFGGTGSKSKKLTPTVVFMEATPADFQALRYLAQRRDFAIGMIVLTVDAWVENLDAAYGNTAAFLQVLRNEGYTATIPVTYGSSVASRDEDFFSTLHYAPDTPVPENTTACTYRRVLPARLSVEAERLFGGASLLDLITVENLANRPAYYAAELDSYLKATSANFLILGPATDAAAFLQSHEQRRSRVERIVIGGGAFLVPGDAQYLYPANREAELNFFFDPKAANYIIGGTHGRPVAVVTLDAVAPWDETAYNKIVTERSTAAPTTAAEVKSADVVGVSLSGYYSQVGSNTRPMSVAVIAATLLADSYALNGAAVSSIYTAVFHTGDMSTDGRSIRTAAGTNKVNVITGANLATITSHLLRVDTLPLG